jgi:hypothetical protein
MWIQNSKPFLNPKTIIMKTRLTYAIPLLSAVLLLSLSSCKKESNATTPTVTVDAAKVNTAYDTTVTFTNYTSIAFPDSVAVINGTTVTYELTAAETQYILALQDSLRAKGFSIVASNSSPDLQINLTRVASTADGMLDNSSYWSNYGSYYSAAAFGESGLPFVTNITASPSIGDGSLSFEMMDLKNATANNQIAIVWDGLITGSTLINDPSLVKPEISILLNKSPYLKNQ